MVIEWGETIAQTLVREVREETNLDVKYDRIIEIVEFINSQDFYQPAHLIAIQCECHLTSPQVPNLDGKELQEYRWFSLSQALKLDNLVPITHHTLTLLQ